MSTKKINIVWTALTFVTIILIIFIAHLIIQLNPSSSAASQNSEILKNSEESPQSEATSSSLDNNSSETDYQETFENAFGDINTESSLLESFGQEIDKN